MGQQWHRAHSPAKSAASPCCLYPPPRCGAVAWARVTLLCRVLADGMGVKVGGHPGVWAPLGRAKSQGCVLLWDSREWAGPHMYAAQGAESATASSRQRRSVFASWQGWLAACVCARVCRAAPIRSLPPRGVGLCVLFPFPSCLFTLSTHVL